jgi:hypothetical protein
MQLGSYIKQFFSENEFDLISDNISIVRNDGIVIYSNKTSSDAQSIGALVGGVWQAAHALNSFISKNDDILEFRLSFDKSDQGVYVLPFMQNKQTFLICAIYKNVNNPGLLKRKLCNLKTSLVSYLLDFKSANKIEREGFLFTNITDEEIDKLFNYSRI